MEKSAKIYVAGHRGLVGSAIVRKLEASGYENLVLSTFSEMDLRNQAAVDLFFAEERPEYVFLAAARVGGIYANNTYPADFIRDNFQVQTNVIDDAWRNRVNRLLFLGSSCIYPKLAPQPMHESCLLTGELEPTNEAYAIAKIAGIKMCQAYHKQYGFDAISAMPTNLYGPNDSFDLDNSHVLPALIRKFHLAKLALAGDAAAIAADEARHGAIPADIRESLSLDSDNPPKVILWGSGNPYREFLHVDDMVAACLFLMEIKDAELAPYPLRLFNLGMGSDVTIRELAELVQKIVGFEGEVIWDSSKPDGTPRKLMDVGIVKSLGWEAAILLEEGISDAYQAYLNDNRA